MEQPKLINNINERGNEVYNMVNVLASPTADAYLNTFNEQWENDEKFSDVIDRVLEYIETFFRNLILNELNELKNRTMLVEEPSQQNTQGANSDYEIAPKCKFCTLNCTLEELAVLRFLQEQPKATQKEIAAHIGKSERTVKTITVNLTEKGIIEHKNGKRNGYWEITTNEFDK